MKAAKFNVKNVNRLFTDDEVFNFSFTEFIKRTINGKNHIYLEIEDIKKIFIITYHNGVLYINRNTIEIGNPKRMDYKNIVSNVLVKIYNICEGFENEE